MYVAFFASQGGDWDDAIEEESLGRHTMDFPLCYLLFVILS